MIRVYFLSIVFTLICFVSNSQIVQPKQEIKWYTLEEAQELMKTQPRKILVDFSTSWCGWCKVMMKNTFTNPDIVNYVNSFYYPIKFEAEGPDSVVFKEKTYYNPNYNPNKKGRNSTHEFASTFAPVNGSIGYPTISYFDENLNLLSSVPGFKKPMDLLPILIFFAEEIFKSTPYDKFQGYFNTAFDSTATDDNLIKWYTVEEALKLNKKKPRKWYIDLYTDWSITSKIMFRTTYNDSIVADYINNNFYPIRFNAMTKDKMKFNDQEYINENKEHPFHQFAVSLLQGKMKFPSVVFLDEDLSKLTSIPGYLTPQGIEPILPFFKDDAYKTTPWDVYMKTFESKIK